MPRGSGDGGCPGCGQALVATTGYSAWCRACQWNLAGDLKVPRSAHDGRARRARRRADRLFAVVSTGRRRAAVQGTAQMAAIVLALFVHGLTVAIAVGAVTLFVAFPNAYIGVLAVLLLALSAFVAPRPGRLKKLGDGTGRTDAPALFTLLDRIATGLTARPPARVVVNGSFNASWRQLGLRRHPVLSIGAPLWAVCEPQQRVALLAHEIAHEVNGDASASFLVGTALSVLSRW